MKRLVNNKSGKVIYGPKWQSIDQSGSKLESEDDLHSSLVGSTETSQISSIESPKQQSPTITGGGDDESRIPKGKRVKSLTDGESMYRAAFMGDWVAAEVLLERDPNLAFDYVTEEGDRALHVAAAMKNADFVKKLVEKMSEDELTLLDGHGYTACCYAAMSGVVETARFMIEKNRNLVATRDEENVTPLHKAALYGNRKMLSYLLKSAQFEDLSEQEWFDLLLATIRSQMYGVAIEIMGKSGSIATIRNEEGSALHLLAQQEIIYSSFGQMEEENKIKSREFVELAKKLWEGMQIMEKCSLLELIKKPHILHAAAKAGHVKLVSMLAHTYPQIILDTDSDGYTIFHTAVIYRRHDVFELIDKVEATIRTRTIRQDQNGNNILHLAAIFPASPGKASRVSAISEMRSEILWFEAVQKTAPPSCAVMRNKSGLTPRHLFTEKHKELWEESKMEMKNTADSGMLIATIMLTVLYAAAFTVPGGYDAQTGEAFLAKRGLFKVFTVSEVLGFIFSLISILLFRCVIASRFVERDFSAKLPMLQILGIEFLLFALVSASVSFMSAILLSNPKIKGVVWFGFCMLFLYGLSWVVLEIRNQFYDVPNSPHLGVDQPQLSETILFYVLEWLKRQRQRQRR